MEITDDKTGFTFEIKQVEGKGRGVFAKETFKNKNSSSIPLMYFVGEVVHEKDLTAWKRKYSVSLCN